MKTRLYLFVKWSIVIMQIALNILASKEFLSFIYARIPISRGEGVVPWETISCRRKTKKHYLNLLLVVNRALIKSTSVVCLQYRNIWFLYLNHIEQRIKT